MKGKWFGLGCLTSLIILIVVFVILFSSLNSYMTKYTGEKQLQTSDSWLILNLQNEVTEFSELSEDLWGKKKSSAHNYIQAIKHARNDDDIIGIILYPQYFAAGYSTLNSLMQALEEFKTSGKPVYAYLNSASNRGYYIATVADKIFLNPSASAGIMLTGIGGHILYYENLLDKLGVEMQVIHAGKYKAAGEQFVRNEMSPEFKENLTALYGDMYEQMLKTIAINRDLDINELRRIYENRENIWINGEYSIKSGLVDQLIQFEQLMEMNNIGKDNKINISNYTYTPPLATGDKIGVLYAQGNITAQSEPAIDVITSSKLIKDLKTLQKNPRIKAVVLRVNSPGGSALESDIILRQIKELQRIKPVIVSMGDVAASGGYYISSNADYIFADPMTITGSIGVVSMFPNLNKMGNKIGVNASSIEYGKYSDILNPWDTPDKDELAAVKVSMLEIYDEFKTHVSQGRSLTLNRVEEIAQGRVWSSDQALKIGLIDEVGDLSSAVEKAAELTGTKQYTITYLPEQKTLMNLLLKEYFGLDMAVQLITGEIEYLDIMADLEILNSIKKDPRQAYCPVNIK